MVNPVADLDDGGRWTSLRLAGREWLWTGPGLITGPRAGMTSYVDAGGLDECFPTVRGNPDHGVLWNQPWSPDGSVRYDEVVLTRHFNAGEPPTAEPAAARSAPRHEIAGPEAGHEVAGPDDTEGEVVWVDYRLTGPPGFRFVWAAHALLDCSVGATISAPAGTATRVYPEAAPLLPSWPDGAPWVESSWPTPLDLGVYGPTDGTAVGAVLVDCPHVSVHDGAELTFTLSCPGQPVSTALWRNLGGFPDSTPYRSLGVEPMLGRVFDLTDAGPGDAAVVPASGELTWRLTISAAVKPRRQTQGIPRPIYGPIKYGDE